jgi:hypothetical protein
VVDCLQRCSFISKIWQRKMCQAIRQSCKILSDFSVKVLKSISLVTVLTSLMEHEHFWTYHMPQHLNTEENLSTLMPLMFNMKLIFRFTENVINIILLQRSNDNMLDIHMPAPSVRFVSIQNNRLCLQWFSFSASTSFLAGGLSLCGNVFSMDIRNWIELGTSLSYS